MKKVFIGIVARDLTLYIRRSGEWVMPMLFFVMVLSLFPMALGFNPQILVKLSPAIIWVSCVLALLLSLENVFRLEYQEGALEQFALSPYPLPLIVLGKSLAHWLAIGLPLLILAPVMGLTLHLPVSSLGILCITLLLGIPTLSLVGFIGAALTIGLHRGGILLSVLVLPLMMPIIVFGSGCVAKSTEGLPFDAELLLLGALFLISLTLAPLTISEALRLGLEG